MTKAVFGRPGRWVRSFLAAGVLLLFAAAPGVAQSTVETAGSHTLGGQRDFDSQIGTWRTELSLLLHPMTDSARWVAYEGTSVVRPLWDGDANLVELDVDGPAGRIEGVSLRLYDPRSRQWSLHYASRRGGRLTAPMVGGFEDGRGLFLGQSSLADGRAVHVRFEISRVAPDRWRFEQSFSEDGGRTWELNWIAVDTRVAEPTAPAARLSVPLQRRVR